MRKLTGRLALSAVGLVVALVGLVVFAGSASAHAVLVSATPSPGSLVGHGRSPSAVVLTFDEPVEAALGAVQVLSSSGARVDDGQPNHPGRDGRKVSVGLHQSLADGSYLVLWHVVSADSHPVHGSFSFSVGRPGALASAEQRGASAGFALTLGVIRFLGYAGFLLLVGLAAVSLLVVPSSAESRRAALLWRLAAVGCLLATLAGFMLQAGFDVGGRWSSLGDPTTLKALAATRLGHAHLARVVLAALLVGLGGKRRRSGAVALVAVALTFAVEGHSGRTLLSIVVDCAHLLSAGAWLGGLVVLLLVVLPSRTAPSEPGMSASANPAQPGGLPAGAASAASGSGRSAAGAVGTVLLPRPTAAEPDPWVLLGPVRRYSWTAMVSVSVLLISGLIQSIRQVPAVGALTATTYGRELGVKVALVGGALLAAGCSSLLVHRRRDGLASDVRLRRLRLSVAVEAALLTAALGVGSALVATAPAAASYRPTQERTVQVGPDTLDVSVVLPAARTLDVHVYSYAPDGTLTPLQQLTGELVPPTRAGLSPITLTLVGTGSGHYLAPGTLVPVSGNWTVRLTAQLSEFDAYTATTTVVIP